MTEKNAGMPLNKNFAIGATIVAVVIFAAAFMPWGVIVATPRIDSPFGNGFPSPFSGMEMSFPISGWNGNITLAGLSLPNWLVVLAAAGVATLCWLKAAAVWNAPIVLSFLLAAYGLLHAGIALAILIASDKGSVGIGSILTTLAFIGIIVILVQQVRSSRPAKSAQPQYN